MKYQQPYGISDPNAVYINGNPSTGTMGSIPPAASIEHPQREIVSVIQASGRTPVDTDLKQLLRVLRAGGLGYYVPTGTGNSIILAMTVNGAPSLDSYYAGMMLRIKNTASNAPGAVTINIDGLGDKPVTKPDGTPLNADDLKVGIIDTLHYDGTRFQVLGAVGQVAVLTDNRNYYVNDVTGNDNYDGASAGTPFRTIQKAVNTVMSFKDLAGYAVNIYVADGTYNGQVDLGPWRGNGTVSLIGNRTNPANCVIQRNGYALGVSGSQAWHVKGFRFNCPAVDAFGRGYGVYCVAGVLYLTDIELGACPYSHILSSQSSYVFVRGNPSDPGAKVRIASNAGSHISCTGRSTIYVDGPNLDILTGVTFSNAFAVCDLLSLNDAYYNTITGAGLVAGPRFAVSGNAVINSHGRGVSYYPGNAPGTGNTLTGGSYL